MTRDYFDGCDNVPLFDLEPMQVQLGPITPTSSRSLADVVRGSHLLPDGTCCHCGPANLISGPRFACDHGRQLTLPAELLPVASGEMFA